METEASSTAPAGEASLGVAAAKALADDRYRELQYARAEIDNVRKRAERIAAERLSAGRRALLGKRDQVRNLVGG